MKRKAGKVLSMKRDFLETYNSIRKAAVKPSKVIVPKKGAYSRKWDWRKEV